MTDEQNDVLLRIEKLEKQNKRLKLIALAPMLVLLSTFLIAAGLLYDGQFVIKDDRDNIRGMLSYSPKTKQGQLILSNSSGRASSEAYNFSTRKMVQLVGGEGGHRWGLDICDENGTPRIFLGIEEPDDVTREKFREMMNDKDISTDFRSFLEGSLESRAILRFYNSSGEVASVYQPSGFTVQMGDSMYVGPENPNLPSLK